MVIEIEAPDVSSSVRGFVYSREGNQIMNYLNPHTHDLSGDPEPEPIELPTYTAGLSIRDRKGKQVLEVTVTGSAHVVAAMITWAGDAFKEDQER